MSNPDDDLAIVHQSNSVLGAELIRALLADNGINAFIPDKNVPLPGVDLTPFSAPGGAGCDVMVAARDLERAKQVIKDARDQALQGQDEGTETADD